MNKTFCDVCKEKEAFYGWIEFRNNMVLHYSYLQIKDDVETRKDTCKPCARKLLQEAIEKLEV